MCLNRYLSQTKPKIILLLTITGIVAFLIPSLDDVKFVDLGLFVFFGVSAAAGALTINNVIDRDIDIQMNRTRTRTSVGPEAIPARNLLIFGVAISIVGIIGGWIVFGGWTGFHLAWGNLFYLFGYSLYLKRNSILNTILGGLASPAPVWAGYAARFGAYESVDEFLFLGVPLKGWLLGGLVFIWTPSHTWAMATKNFEDYVNTDIPMLPVVVGIEKTGLITMIAGLVTLIFGTWLVYLLSSSILLLIFMIPLDIYFFYGLWIFYSRPSVETGTTCFEVHNYWLTLVFLFLLIFIALGI